jgi:hypothetical protein
LIVSVAEGRLACGDPKETEGSAPSQHEEIGRIFPSGLAPIVESVNVRPTVAGLVRTMHRDDLHLAAKSAITHLVVGVLACQIDPCYDRSHADFARKR